ncbi:hypothetical protein CLAFUW4_20028 [Fulvia fulva]|uniref:uncharacterized protein n=1 Tax=Passalora fulva TaxID=5499 RepID=UPI002852AD78|nr:uncharacterized protein CLAFUR5_20028 [Fulvia fulva]KAK4626260.1 hypothetical protein CLAFUR4_20028 [Fulvia fulva]KAK4627852.1 hypothetical protein CLAFUR0_20028 [Fulvia fulva]WMI38851.1 hypothetical protein CLAFUR5_20028 [Fulvia fulva]WPV13412.1 hypothetical protein CLAFUW4_20028 [Fulvia fulva]WPV29173.1 hypothetical protein CLAFUW7_20028 [Fulvia fulva]
MEAVVTSMAMRSASLLFWSCVMTMGGGTLLERMTPGVGPPHGMASLYDGEVYDAGVRVPTADSFEWRPVRSMAIPRTITAPDGPPARRIEEIPVTKMFKSSSGKSVLDFGQNFAGLGPSEA